MSREAFLARYGAVDILAAFERRLANTREAELEEALRRIHRIARSRLEAMND